MAIYNLSASVGTRAKEQSAAAKYDYITRGGKYAEDAAEVERVADGNMPAWAEDNPRDYWQAADEGERANGSLFREVQFALPEELSRGERLELAEGFARELTTGDERLPYTLAVHRGEDVNPHAHLMISERVHDGNERSAETWFRRYNRQAPERGGARKTRAMQPPRGLESRDWLATTRAAWERQANKALERSGSRERIDRRSWSIRREDALKQGDLEEAARCSRIPNVHRGPRRRRRNGLERKDRRIRAENERRNSEVARIEKRIAAVEAKIARLTQARLALASRIVELSKEEEDLAKITVRTIHAGRKQAGVDERPRRGEKPPRERAAPATSSEEPPPEPGRWQRYQQRRKKRRNEASREQFTARAAGRVIEQLEKGAAPWQRGWDSPQSAQEPPYNPVSGARYDGLNAIVLRCEALQRGYSDPRWLTFNQAKKNGVQVRKGEQGTRLEYWQFPAREESRGQDAPAEAGQEKSEVIHRTYTVFNAEQCNRMPAQPREWVRDWKVSERAERLLEASGADIEHRSGERAGYQVSEDKIVLPGQERFRTPEVYYATAVHELGHWSGHKSRLDRETLRQGIEEGFGSDAYAREQLRADLTSMTVNGVLRLPHLPGRHASHVDSWIRVLKNDPDELRRAARDAGAAAEHLLQYDREMPRDKESLPVVAGLSSTRERERTRDPDRKPKQAQGHDLADDLMSR